MIGIYHDDFSKYLEDALGHVKITSKNIVVPCPWCEYKKKKKHYHLYISLEAPIFHCFHAICEESGTLRKLLKKIEGNDISDNFIDKNKLEVLKKKQEIFDNKNNKTRSIIVPPLKPSVFPNKELYMKKRFKFANLETSMIKGLIYDVNEFIQQNHIVVDETLFRLRDYLHSNFVGFLTEHNSTVIFRNIDNSHTMKFFKLKIFYTSFLDYYKLNGNNPLSKQIVLAEGVFDIFSAYIFDHLKIKDNTKLYASVLSSNYRSLLYSIVFNEMVFQPDVIILSDRGIPLSNYQKLKKYNRHVISSLTVYYNKTGKDFNDTPVTPVKYII